MNFGVKEDKRLAIVFYIWIFGQGNIILIRKRSGNVYGALATMETEDKNEMQMADLI